MKRIAQVAFFFVALKLALSAQAPPLTKEGGLTTTKVLAVTLAAPKELAGEDFKNEMQRTVEAWKDAFNNNEMDKLAAMYTEDGSLLDEDGMISGRAVLRAAFTKFRASGASMSSISVDRAESSGNIGYLTDSWTEVAPKAGGGTETVQGYSLVVMKRVGNKWLMSQHAAIAKPK
jgi:ketosteroid isomerase-like protein